MTPQPGTAPAQVDEDVCTGDEVFLREAPLSGRRMVGAFLGPNFQRAAALVNRQPPAMRTFSAILVHPLDSSFWVS